MYFILRRRKKLYLSKVDQKYQDIQDGVLVEFPIYLQSAECH